MPEWEIRGRLTGLVTTGLEAADNETLNRVVDELPPGAQLVGRTAESCDIRFRIEAVDATDASIRGFDLLQTAALRHLIPLVATSATAVLVSGTVDPRAAIDVHLRSAFMNLARVTGLYMQVRLDLEGAAKHFGSVGLDEHGHQTIMDEIFELEQWTAEKMQQMSQRLAELEARSRG